MIQQKHRFLLTLDELAYLEGLISDQPVSGEIFTNVALEGLGQRSLLITTQESETLRGIFTEKLAEVGFDADYSLTKEGVMLERLIDRFFVPT